ncbi:MAG: hypothetical protein Q9167_007669 [Letrouitia subvulpina]
MASDIAQHPLKNAIAVAAGSDSTDPRAEQKSSFFQGLNEGSADHAAKITGLVSGGKREDDGAYFTNNEGIPWPDPKNVGGIPLISDPFLLQKQQTFNRSKNLERAFSKRSRPEFPDLARNPREFAIKFYTGEGNYDMVGLNFPIFFCRDPIQGPDVIRSQHRNPANFLIDNDALFDLLGCTPEANHAALMFSAIMALPGDGATTMEGNFVYIKYHFIADHGQKQFTAPEATKLCGEDPDYSKRDLWEAIENEDPDYEPNEADFDKLGFDPFDVTKVWPRDKFPMYPFGRLTLNKNPENFHRDVEQAAFSPGSLVPGIEDSPDHLLQFRMFFYRDAQ